MKETKATFFEWNREHEKVDGKAEYYEEKSRSIEMFNTIKVCAELLREFIDGKSSSWNPEAKFIAWEKMKTLYFE